eukprot:gene10151-7108_t
MQEFHAFVVHPGKEERLSIPASHGFHLSVISLPHGKSGRTTLYVTVDGKPYALGTIDTAAQGKPLQISTDLVFNAEQHVTFHAKGSAPVHCIGYVQSLEESDSFPGDGEEDFDLPIEAAQGKVGKRPRVEEAESSDDEEDADSEMSDDYEEVQPPSKRVKLSDPTQAHADDEEDSDDDDEEDDEDDEEEDDEDDEEEDDEDDDDDEDDEDDEDDIRVLKIGMGFAKGFFLVPFESGKSYHAFRHRYLLLEAHATKKKFSTLWGTSIPSLPSTHIILSSTFFPGLVFIISISQKKNNNNNNIVESSSEGTIHPSFSTLLSDISLSPAMDLVNPEPRVFTPEDRAAPLRSEAELTAELDEDVKDPLDAAEVFQLIRNIRDPEHPLTLEELRVVEPSLITVNTLKKIVSVQFTPTVPHCSLTSLIGLCITLELERTLPPFFKIDVSVTPGSHNQEEQVNQQLGDKERVAAALENPNLLKATSSRGGSTDRNASGPRDFILTFSSLAFFICGRSGAAEEMTKASGGRFNQWTQVDTTFDMHAGSQTSAKANASVEMISSQSDSDSVELIAVTPRRGGASARRTADDSLENDSRKRPRSGMLDALNAAIDMAKAEEDIETRSVEVEMTQSSTSTQSQISLSAQQQAIVDVIVKGKRSVFITGGAGTGKTFLLRAVIEQLPRHTTFVTATTGIAALQLGGSTLHSFAGCGLVNPRDKKSFILQRVNRAHNSVIRWRRCKVLVVDEVSMLDGTLFEMLEYIARRIRGSRSPFGGIQLVLCGDFLQLPPVSSGSSAAPFCFESRAWVRCNPKVCELAEPFRQNSPEFFAMLSNMRFGFLSPEQEDRLAQLSSSTTVMYVKEGPPTDGTEIKFKNESGADGSAGPVLQVTDDRGGALSDTFDGYTFLRPVRREVDRQNNRFYGALQTPQFFYVGFHEGKGSFPEKDIPLVLHLRVGCRVMLTKNLDVAAGLVNGSAGTIVGFFDFKKNKDQTSLNFSTSNALRVCRGSSERGSEKAHAMLPIVEFEIAGSAGLSGTVRKVVVEPTMWTELEGDKTVSCTVQLPLIVAFAITIHKSQGMSLSTVDIDFSSSFESGQAYVALSRCRELEGVRLHGFTPAVVMVSEKALSFYQALTFVREKEMFWSSLESEVWGIAPASQAAEEEPLPLPPCGYLCDPQVAQEDDDDIKFETQDSWAHALDSPLPQYLATAPPPLQNEFVEITWLWQHMRPLLRLTEELKDFIRGNVQPMTAVCNALVVMDAESFMDMHQIDPVSQDPDMAGYQQYCEKQGNMIRVPRVVFDFFTEARSREAIGEHKLSEQRSRISASQRRRALTPYSVRPSQIPIAVRVLKAMERAKERMALEVQNAAEVSRAFPEIHAAWRAYAPVLPLFTPVYGGLDNDVSVEACKRLEDFVSFTLNRHPREGQHHREVLEYALHLRNSCTGVSVVLCTGSITLAASGMALGLSALLRWSASMRRTRCYRDPLRNSYLVYLCVLLQFTDIYWLLFPFLAYLLDTTSILQIPFIIYLFYNMPEQFRAAHLLIKNCNSRNPVSRRTNQDTSGVSEEDAISELQQWATQIASGKITFEEAAHQRSDCGSYAKNGDLGYFGPGEMMKPFEDAVRALKPGEVSGIVKTDSGLAHGLLHAFPTRAKNFTQNDRYTDQSSYPIPSYSTAGATLNVAGACDTEKCLSAVRYPSPSLLMFFFVFRYPYILYISKYTRDI